jgi:hypothetical protein
LDEALKGVATVDMGSSISRRAGLGHHAVEAARSEFIGEAGSGRIPAIASRPLSASEAFLSAGIAGLSPPSPLKPSEEGVSGQLFLGDVFFL